MHLATVSKAIAMGAGAGLLWLLLSRLSLIEPGQARGQPTEEPKQALARLEGEDVAAPAPFATARKSDTQARHLLPPVALRSARSPEIAPEDPDDLMMYLPDFDETEYRAIGQTLDVEQHEPVAEEPPPTVIGKVLDADDAHGEWWNPVQGGQASVGMPMDADARLQAGHSDPTPHPVVVGEPLDVDTDGSF